MKGMKKMGGKGMTKKKPKKAASPAMPMMPTAYSKGGMVKKGKC